MAPETPNLPLPLSETPEQSKTCSKALWALLTTTAEVEETTRRISSSPALLDETREMANVLAGQLVGAGAETVAAVIAKTMAHFGVRDLPAQQQRSVLAPYIETLAEVPKVCLLQALRAWHRCELYPDEPGRHAFMPRASEIYALAKPRTEKLRKAAYRAKRVIEYQPKAPRPPPSAEEKAKVQAMLAEFRSGGKNPLADPPNPSVSRQAMADRLRRAAEDGR